MTASDYNDCVKNNADGLYRFMLKSVRRTEDARDLVQSSFEKLWQHRSAVDAVSSKSYLFTIAYHLMIDQTRKNRRVDYVEAIPDNTVFQPKSGTQIKEVLDMALNRLNDKQRSMVLLKDYEGYSYEEIAGIMDLTASQVKVNLYRARLQLKEWLVSVEHVL